jgi:hypothetical protein
VPGFAVGFEEASVGSFFAGWVDYDHFSQIKYIHGNNIKRVVRDDVGGEEVDVLGGVSGAASVFMLYYVDGKTVGIVKARDGDALYLDSQDTLATFEQEIVGTPFSIGPRRGET